MTTTRRRTTTLFVALLLAWGVGTPSAFSATPTWLPASGNWGTGSNWSGGSIPSSQDTAVIDNNRTALVSVGTSGTVGGLQVGDSTGTGSLTVQGGLVQNGIDGLFIGYSGTGTLTVQGGSVSSGKSYIGYFANSSGTATVTSGTWTNGNLTVGEWGTGTLNISGGIVKTTQSPAVIGDAAASNGTVSVTSGTWNSLPSLTVGNSGTGSLNLNATGVVTVNGGNGTLTLATNAGSVGTLNLGSGSGAGTLNAATVNGGSGSATVNFNHTGSYTFSSNLTGNLSVNKLGSGTTVLTGSTSNYSGLTTVSAGELDVNGSLSSGGMLIGGSTGGALRINGGIVNGWGILGHDAGSIGTAVISSGTWNADGLTVGASGTGTLTIGGSGTVFVGGGPLYLATQYGSGGTLNMGDGNSVGTLNASGISVGSGTATVNFNHAGNYTFTQSLTGNVSISKLGSGTTTLAGNQYQLNSMTVSAGELDVTSSPYYAVQTNSIVVGGSTGAVLRINGGTVLSNSALVGFDAGSVGVATVSSGTWNIGNTEGLHVGSAGQGTLTIGAGGVVNVGGFGTLYLADQYGSTGTLNMGDGTSVGTLYATSINVGGGTATVNFNHTGSYTFSTPINGYFNLNKLGSGTTVLAGNYQVNSMTVSDGEMSVNGLLGSYTHLVNVGSGATLSGSGTINADVAVNGTLKGTLHTVAISGSGLISPGNSPGILTTISADISSGMSFAFEFTLPNTNPIYSNATASGNDILHLTGASPFSGNLTADNVISIYLQSAVAGDSYLGGFFTGLSDAQLEAAIQNAKFAFYVEDDANGTITFNGKNYDSLNAALISMGALNVTGANFADGTVNGSEMKLTVVPEPNTWAILIGGAGLMACFRRCRKRNS